MKDYKIDKAVQLAKEFIELVAKMKKAELEKSNEIESIYQFPSPLHRGFVKRKSMDLTRALAEMRKP